MTDTASLIREERALRELAKSNPDALRAYRRLLLFSTVYGNALDRIRRRNVPRLSMIEEVDYMRTIAIDAFRDVEFALEKR